MASRIPLPPPGFDDLAVDEKLEYVQALWDRIAADEAQVPAPEWHKQVLKERLEARDTDARRPRSWDKVREDLRPCLQQREGGQ